MTNRLIVTVAFIGLTFSSALAANNNDFASQVSIKAGKQTAQLKTNIGIFEQNVEIIHGNRQINADRLEVHRRAELGENKQLLVATGNPARFTETQVDGTVLSATASEVRYDVANKKLTIKGDAEINQAGQIIKAQSIIYDMDKQLINAEKGNENTGRVHTILVPEKKSNKEQGK
ncbi:lipopolysaccharide transport periplasmic protein LptA [Pseudoalteromonas aurantia]|uniref:Lipopolysaccharide export system protein LptA n=1 Tax=Pseudoalteromonas aurantia 208 TaxID=1314867 RepID=A0ABR9E751_9GAMM|nr:lipopolysaccharide transport periplasmic protein LptA [Pseudoalteromonas aurantia]MBE0366809.1 lipopolysaccharide export system protein LptA [Pseudoalteromonas aurantia 208]